MVVRKDRIVVDEKGGAIRSTQFAWDRFAGHRFVADLTPPGASDSNQYSQTHQRNYGLLISQTPPIPSERAEERENFDFRPSS